VANDIKTSLVVLTYNRADALLEVLRGLAPQCGAGHEIIIADDGSSASSMASWINALPSIGCPVRHVWHPDKGFTASRARNLGAMLSQGEYLVFLDGDCIPNPRFLRAHEVLAEEGCFVNGNRVLLSEALTGQVLARDVDVLNASLSDWLRWRTAGNVNKLSHLLYWPSAPLRMQQHFRWKKIRSCNFAVWKDDFLKINGFDETFEGWGHEDADLVLRLHNAGVRRKNGFCCSEVYHLWHRQHSRDSENINFKRVLDRMQSGLVSATRGLLESQAADDVVVTSLN
jgi:glycosyltransferase involved in cell wall biosynthesis